MPELKIDFKTSRYGIVQLDGQTLTGIIGIDLHMRPGDITRAEIELLAPIVEIALDVSETIIKVGDRRFKLKETYQ